MLVFRNPDRNEWSSILERPILQQQALQANVAAIMESVSINGDTAIQAYTKQFDKADISEFELTSDDKLEAIAAVPSALKAAIQTAATNIKQFHEKQLQTVEVIETMPGINCWRKSVGIDKVGLYIPGGTAPLFSTVLMLGIPAAIAGCKEIILCSPPDTNGNIHPAIVYAAEVAGIKRVFRIGGVQAIAAMTFGTASIPKVYKIFGPGNQYVTAAKQLAQQYGVAIDMPAGPSEVCVLADTTADPSFIAADLLSQAEHGADSQVLLVTTHEPLLHQVQAAVEKQLAVLPRKEFAEKALVNSRLVFVEKMSDAIEIVNEYAAEHLIIQCEFPEQKANDITNAGSVFLGHYSPESVGDYASGTNHTLPTNGYARMYSGVSVDSFVKKITYQSLSPAGLSAIADAVITMAEAEQLAAHAEAVRIRLLK